MGVLRDESQQAVGQPVLVLLARPARSVDEQVEDLRAGEQPHLVKLRACGRSGGNPLEVVSDLPTTSLVKHGNPLGQQRFKNSRNSS